MARRGSSRARRTAIPGPLRPIIGGIALVASVRIVDALWRRATGRPVPTEGSEGTDESRMVRDRLVYALLLGGAMRVARRLGLPLEDAAPGDDGPEDAGR
jgi:hypothetical protein